VLGKGFPVLPFVPQCDVPQLVNKGVTELEPNVPIPLNRPMCKTKMAAFAECYGVPLVAPDGFI